MGKQLAPLWKVLAEKLEVLFPEGDDTGAFIVPALDARSQVLSIQDCRNGVGKPVFKLAPFGNGQLFALTALDLCVPGIPDDVLQQDISQASHLAQNRTADVRWPPFRLPAFSPPGGSRPLFSAFSLFRFYKLLSLARCLTLQDAAPCHRKDSLYECGLPHDTLSCLLFTALRLQQSQSILTQVQKTNDIDFEQRHGWHGK